MRQSAVLVVLLLLAGVMSASQEEKNTKEKPPAEFKIPAEEARRENPVKPAASSIAEGKRLFGYDCAMCHGKDGDGKGDLAEQMALKLPDFRDPLALKDRTDGELSYIISKGKGKMLGEEDRLKPEQRWHLINFIRSLAKKEPPGQPSKP